MRHNIFISLIGFVICLNIFLGCGSLKTAHLTKKYFDLNTIVLDPSNIDLGSAVLVKEFSINTLFDSHSFVYRVDDNKYINDYYNEFVNYPAKVVSDKIAQALYGSIHFIPALNVRPKYIKYRLSGEIIKLHGDFRKINKPEAIIEIRMILEQKKENSFQKIIDNRYSGLEPVFSTKPDQLIKGWNRGLSKITGKFIEDFILLREI
jgi:hypothetical protein